jgi:hypothetical protein
VKKFHVIDDSDHLITRDNVAKIADAYAEMSADLNVLLAKVAALRAGLDALAAERDRQAAQKAASDAFRAAQQ